MQSHFLKSCIIVLNQEKGIVYGGWTFAYEVLAKLEEAKAKKSPSAGVGRNGISYTIMGEYHPEWTIGDLLRGSLELYNYKVFYMEALRRGEYGEERDGLKDIGGNSGTYSYNTLKYDRIINEAVLEGVEVHGIARADGVRHCSPESVREWAEYMINTSKGRKSLTLVGNTHVSDRDRSITLPEQLKALGVKERDMLTVASAQRISFTEFKISPGLYYLKEVSGVTGPTFDSIIKEGAVDMVFVI